MRVRRTLDSPPIRNRGMAIQEAALNMQDAENQVRDVPHAGNELKGKVALVTGATKNIGRAIALSLANAGAAVAVNSRASQEDGEKVVREIAKAGGRAHAYVADVAEQAAVAAMVN